MNLRHLLPFSAVLVLGFLDSGVECQSLACPAVRTTSGWLDLFPLPCRKHSECKVMTKQHLCCKGVCTKGVKAAVALKSTTYQPSLSSVAPTSTSTTTSTTSTTPSTTTSTTTTTTTPSTTTSTTTTTTTTTTPSTTSSTTTTTTTTPKPTTTTTEPPLQPFLQFLPIQRVEASTVQSAPVKSSKTGKGNKLVCPKPGQAPVLLFPIPCEKNSQCRASSGADHVCCDGRCIRGVPAPKPTTTPAPVSHQPLLGVIPRECPTAPLGELLFEVQSCKSDADCWPRLCCPDGTRSYCRTARARLDLVPVANQIDGPVRMLESYLQCTAPPQYDLFPQKCSSSVDCFPNLCCAEGGKKHCRPPQRSLLALLAGVTQRVGSTIGNLRQARNNRNNA